ncbi:MAG: hypothetical protein ACI4SH_08180, partial [Candidatus Scatosoma sp.]
VYFFVCLSSFCEIYYTLSQNRALEKMLAVEECNRGGATAFILFAETKAEAEQAETEYALWNRIPEQDETTGTLNGVYWRERVYVFGDDGGGIVYFRRVPLLDEK